MRPTTRPSRRARNSCAHGVAEERVARGVELGPHVAPQGRREAGVVPVELVREGDEGLEVPPPRDRDDLDSSHVGRGPYTPGRVVGNRQPFCYSPLASRAVSRPWLWPGRRGRGRSRRRDDFEQGVRRQSQLRRDARGARRGLRRGRTRGGREGPDRPGNGPPARLRLRRVRERRGRAEVHRADERARPQGSRDARERGRGPAAAPGWRARRRLLEARGGGGFSRPGGGGGGSRVPAGAAASRGPAAASGRAARPPSRRRKKRAPTAGGASSRSPSRSPCARPAPGVGATTSSTTTTPITSKPGGPTPRTTVRRLPERGRYDRDTIHAILDEAFVCHVGFVDAGQPFVIPTAFARIGDEVVIHGSAASRMLKLLCAGAPGCLTVTLARRPGARALRLPPLDELQERRGAWARRARSRDPAEKAPGARRDRRAHRAGAARQRARRLGAGAARDARRRVRARRGVGQAAHGPAEGRRGGLRARGVGGRAAAAAPGARAASPTRASRPGSRCPRTSPPGGAAGGAASVLRGAARRPAGRRPAGAAVRRRAAAARSPARDAAPHPAGRTDRGGGRAAGARPGRGRAPGAGRGRAARARRVGHARRARARRDGARRLRGDRPLLPAALGLAPPGGRREPDAHRDGRGPGPARDRRCAFRSGRRAPRCRRRPSRGRRPSGVPRPAADAFLRDQSLAFAKSDAIAAWRRARRNPRLFLSELSAVVRERPVVLVFASLAEEFTIRGLALGEGPLRAFESRLERGFLRVTRVPDGEAGRLPPLRGARAKPRRRPRRRAAGARARIPSSRTPSRAAWTATPRARSRCGAARRPPKDPGRGPLTLRLRDLDLADVFQVLAALGAGSFVVDGDVAGRASVEVTRATLDETLAAIRKGAGVEIAASGSVRRVGAARPAAPRPAAESGPPASFALKRAEVRDVLAAMAEVDPQLAALGPPGFLGRASVWTRDAPLGAVRAALLESAGLGERIEEERRVLTRPLGNARGAGAGGPRRARAAARAAARGAHRARVPARGRRLGGRRLRGVRLLPHRPALRLPRRRPPRRRAGQGRRVHGRAAGNGRRPAANTRCRLLPD